MKRITNLVWMLCMTALLTAGCGEGDSTSSAGARSTDGSQARGDALMLAVIPKSTGGEFWETVEMGAREAGTDLNVGIKWEGTLSETDFAEQNKIIENMINLDVDGIALAPLNKQAQAKLVKQAADEGIPVVIFDSAVNGDSHVSFVATDNHQGGVLGAKHMIELFGANKGRVMVQRYVQGTGSTEARADGFIETVTAAGVEIAAQPYADDGSVAGAKKTASNTFEGFIKDNKLELDGVFACNLYSALGALAALDDLRKGGVEVNTKFIGFDSSEKLIAAVQDGSCDALVVQNPKKMGYLAVETLTRHLRDEKVTAMVDTGVELVTKQRLIDDAELRTMVGLR